MNDKERYERAVWLIRKQLTPEFVNIFRYAMGQDQSQEIFLQRAGIGLAIRNLLAQEGVFWEEMAMAEIWLEMLKESAFGLKNLKSVSVNGRETTTDTND